MQKISYAGYRFPPEVIHQAIWLYLRFTLSFRDVEDLLAERGIMVSYETVRRRVNHFGPIVAATCASVARSRIRLLSENRRPGGTPSPPNDWSRTTCDHTALRRASSDLNAGATAGDGKTIERRIHTSRPGGGSARCSASRAPAPRRSFFQPTPPSTTPSTYNAISSQPKPTVRFALRR